MRSTVARGKRASSFPDRRMEDVERATQTLGRSKVSSTSDAFTPASLSNLVLWLRADQGVATTGSLVDSWTSIDGSSRVFSASGAERPTLVSSDSGLNNQSSIDFDGTDDKLINTSLFLTTTSGIAYFAFQGDALTGSRTLFAKSDTGANTNYIELTQNASTANPQPSVHFRSGSNHVKATNSPGTSASYLSISSNDTAWDFRLDGSDETEVIITNSNTGQWFGDLTSPDEESIGGFNILAGGTNHYDGAIAEIIIYSEDKSLADKQRVEAYLAKRYAI